MISYFVFTNMLELSQDREVYSAASGNTPREMSVQPEHTRFCDSGKDDGQHLAAVALQKMDVPLLGKQLSRPFVKLWTQLDRVDFPEAGRHSSHHLAKIGPGLDEN